MYSFIILYNKGLDFFMNGKLSLFYKAFIILKSLYLIQKVVIKFNLSSRCFLLLLYFSAIV